jgi:hypothetical protein
VSDGVFTPNTLGGLAILGCIDLFVGAVDAAAQQLHEDTPPVGYVIDARQRQVGQMDAVGLPGVNGDCFHRQRGAGPSRRPASSFPARAWFRSRYRQANQLAPWDG